MRLVLHCDHRGRNAPGYVSKHRPDPNRQQFYGSGDRDETGSRHRPPRPPRSNAKERSGETATAGRLPRQGEGRESIAHEASCLRQEMRHAIELIAGPPRAGADATLVQSPA
jgi:hypothetical protein